uniref:G_PROTEIN_RECEP_F1_2 domain-containing protein n=1 Tax=Globodera pallida TaxID=36090 RepID=A0A183C0W7_GLOPA
MTVISFDRYLGVSQPLKRHNKRKRTLLKIFIVWILSTIISSPLALLSFVEQQNILAGNRCGIRSRFFMLYGSVFSFLIPLAIMAITTSRTTHLLQRQAILLGAGNHFNGGLRRMMAPQRKMGGQAPMMFITNFSGGLANSSSSTTTSSGRSGTITQQTQNCQRRLSFSTGSPIQKPHNQIQSPSNFSTTAFRVGEKHCAVVHQRRPPLDSPIIKISPAATDEKLFKSGNNNPSVAKTASNECKFIQQKQKQNATPSPRKGSLFGAAFWTQSLLRKSAESSGGESQGTKARQRRRRRVRTGRAKRTAELASEQKATRISDSDEKEEEEEFNATSSLESNEEAEEVDDVEQGVALIARNCVAFGDILRKMSWQHIARSLSVDLEHHQHQNGNRMRRDCTMYSLLTVPGEVALGGSADHFACGGVTLLQKKSAPTFVNESAKTNSWESNDGNHLLDIKKKFSPSNFAPTKRMQNVKSVRSVKGKENAERFDAASEQFFSKQIHKITTTKTKI